jgi:hypothetical protein
MESKASSAPEAVDTSHWAYREGREEGLAGNTTKRGIMAFGLNCAGDRATVVNTRLWLQGFDAGVIEAKKIAEAAKNAKPVDPWNVCGDRPPRSRSESYSKDYS